MRKLSTKIIIMALFAFFLAGCATVGSPLAGLIYTNITAPLAVAGSGACTKFGRSSAHSIAGFIASGDASITAAAKNGGITKIDHVDYHIVSGLGIYSTYETIVCGE